MSSDFTDSSTRKDGSEVAHSKPVVAAFSPFQQTTSRTLNRSSILIHQKSPLLVATPPQVTRTLAYSHAFILPLNHVVGLLSWTSGDRWESFLLVATFWLLVLYGDDVTRWCGPLVLLAVLVAGIYSRRYSPLSSKGKVSDEKGKLADPDTRKSLDEILETLNEFTRRCDVLVDPLLRLTEYLSTQSSPTSATTRPALTTLFIRILAFTPIWIGLTLPPLRIITTQRVILTLGTVGLTWHSLPASACRVILWRSRTVRKSLSLLTGLHFPVQSLTPVPLPPTLTTRAQAAAAIKNKIKGSHPRVRFTFTVFENQRRWLGLGWTASLLPGDGEPWTDEHQHSSPEPKDYNLPETENETTKWRWVSGSEWHIDGGDVKADSGWTYCDNYWRDPHRADGFSRYTRRRKWCRDAELIEADIPDPDLTPKPSSNPFDKPIDRPAEIISPLAQTDTVSRAQKPGWFRRRHMSTTSASSAPDHSDAVSLAASTAASSRKSRNSTRSDEDPSSDDVHVPLDQLRYQADWDRSVSENVWQGLS